MEGLSIFAAYTAYHHTPQHKIVQYLEFLQLWLTMQDKGYVQVLLHDRGGKQLALIRILPPQRIGATTWTRL
jgi:hypothetical protein